MAMTTINEQQRPDRGFQHIAPGQRGSLLIMAIILIVIVSLLGAVITSLFTGSSRADIDNTAAAEALYIAESGLERGIREWSLNPGTYVGEGPLSFGAGNFTVLSPDDLDFNSNPLPANRKHITSTGIVSVAGGNAMRSFEAIVESAIGGGGNLLTNSGFDNPGTTCPPEPTNWNVNAPGNDCNNGVALGGGVTGLAGDTTVFSRKTGGGGTNLTTVTQNLAAICTTMANTTFTVTFDYRYLETPASGGSNHSRMRFYLRRTTGQWQQSNWLTINNSTGGWQSHPGMTISVPGGRSLDTFEVRLETSGNVNKTLWIDNIVVTGGTCGTTTATQIIGWQEVPD